MTALTGRRALAFGGAATGDELGDTWLVALAG